MDQQISVNTGARAIRDMYSRMAANNVQGPAGQIVQDMGRLSEAMNSLDVVASDTNPEISREMRQAKTMKTATKISDALGGVSERLQKLEATANANFNAAFLEHSGLAHSANASEIRAYLNTLTLAQRQAFLQDALKGNDNETLSAVILAPSYLSGMPLERHSALKAQIEEIRLPELAASRRQFRELAENLKTGIGVAVESTRSYSNPHTLKLHAEQAAKMKAAEAQLAGGVL